MKWGHITVAKYKMGSYTYELPGGQKVHHIKAKENFADVNDGDFGGYVESEDNLDQNGEAWIYGESAVIGSARICDNAKIIGSIIAENGRVCENAVVVNSVISGDTVVSGCAKLKGCAFLGGNSVIDGDTNIEFKASNTGMVYISYVKSIGKGENIKRIVSLDDFVLDKSLDGKKFDDYGYYLHDYHRYWLSKRDNIKNPKFDEDSNRILDFKSDEQSAIDYYCKCMEKKFERGCILTCVPSHDSDPTKVTPNMRLIRAITKPRSFVDGSSFLRRVTTIEKLATGGGRSFDVHYNTIKCTQPNLITGKYVILIDDVVTTGESMAACEKILYDNGAKGVIKLAFSKTFVE